MWKSFIISKKHYCTCTQNFGQFINNCCTCTQKNIQLKNETSWMLYNSYNIIEFDNIEIYKIFLWLDYNYNIYINDLKYFKKHNKYYQKLNKLCML